MKSAKQFALAAVLVLISIAAVMYGLRALRQGKAMPKWVRETPTEKIDAATFEVMTKPLQEWEDLGKMDGKYKNPSTGKYTMTDIMTCAGCGEVVPQPDFPKGTIPGAVLNAYICPKCGKRVMAGGMPGAGER